MKCLWVVSGGVEAVPGIRQAKDMGLYVVVSDGSPEAPGFQFADHAIVASTYDVQHTLKEALAFHKEIRSIDGVVCFAADVPLTVSSIAHALGLPGISMETARLASDKLEMKKRFREKGVPIPWFSPVESPDHLKQIISERRQPLVIKPVDSRGARGVLRLTDEVDLAWAYTHAMSFSPTSRVMVEEFLEGPQISTESILLNGKAFTPGFADRNYEYLERFAPFIIENGGEQPSRLAPAEIDQVKSTAEKAALALGIEDGIAKGDLVLTKEGPKVIEIAARLSGGWFSSDQIPLATGVDLIRSAIKISLGEEVDPCELVQNYWKGVAIRYFFPRPGRITEIKNLEKVQDMPWIHKMMFFVRPGDILPPVTDHTKRAGFVITQGTDREQAVERARHVIETVEIETEPV